MVFDGIWGGSSGAATDRSGGAAESQDDDSDNKGGAGGTIGLAQFVNAAKGDANALMMGGMVMVGAIYLDNAPVNLTMVTPVARLTGRRAGFEAVDGERARNARRAGRPRAPDSR